MSSNNERIWHLVGAGGSGMSAVAQLLLQRGDRVSGSDSTASPYLDKLKQAGATVVVGHAAENVASGATIVVSTAIRPDNPEVLEAKRQGLPIMHRSQALAEIMAGQTVIAITGTHGKTTVTAMTVSILRSLGLDPSFAIGASVPAFGTNAALGNASIFVLEADESDRSFFNYSPTVAVVTNIEGDHFDYFSDMKAVEEAFSHFLDQLAPEGKAVICIDDPGARRLADRLQERGTVIIRYGRYPDAQFRLGGSSGHWHLAVGEETYPLPLAVPGDHNALNAIGALAAVHGAVPDLPIGPAAASLGQFQGARRRFELVGRSRGVSVIDDYAHHPTEVHATVTAARGYSAARGLGRVLVLFQPHHYSRTQQLAFEFARAFLAADQAWILPIFEDRENPIPGVSSATITDAAKQGRKNTVTLVSNAEEAIEKVCEAAQVGDIVIVMGAAGDVPSLAPRILAALKEGD